MNRKPFIIGVAGGTACGKSLLCKRIIESLNKSKHLKSKNSLAIISVDSFYKPITSDELKQATTGDLDLDHPNRIDFAQIVDVINGLRNGRAAKVPKYCHKTYSRIEGDFHLISSEVVVLIIEGVLAFYTAELLNLMDLKFFVECDADIRLSRKLQRDTTKNGRDLKVVIKNYFKFVKPAFEEFCLPSKKYADVILPRGAENTKAIELIVLHIEDILSQSNSLAENGAFPSFNRSVTGDGGGRLRNRLHSESSTLYLSNHLLFQQQYRPLFDNTLSVDQSVMTQCPSDASVISPSTSLFDVTVAAVTAAASKTAIESNLVGPSSSAVASTSIVVGGGGGGVTTSSVGAASTIATKSARPH